MVEGQNLPATGGLDGKHYKAVMGKGKGKEKPGIAL